MIDPANHGKKLEPQPLFVGFVVVLLVAYGIFSSITTAWPYLACAKLTAQGDRLFSQSKYEQAESFFRSGLKVCDTAEDTKVGLVRALFQQSTNEKNHEALQLLKTMQLSKTQKVKVLNAAPQTYWRYISEDSWQRESDPQHDAPEQSQPDSEPHLVTPEQLQRNSEPQEDSPEQLQRNSKLLRTESDQSQQSAQSDGAEHQTTEQVH